MSTHGMLYWSKRDHKDNSDTAGVMVVSNSLVLRATRVKFGTGTQHWELILRQQFHS